MSNKNKKVCMALNYIEHSLTLDFVVTGCISISDFSSLVDIYTRIISSTVGLNICAIIAKFKKLIIKKNKQKHDEVALLAKIRLTKVRLHKRLNRLIYCARLFSFLNRYLNMI